MESIKKNLRSVLLSKVGGVPLKNVERDYRSLVGERLDWRQFGFRSFEAFLNDIPDVVKVAFRKDAMHAYGVAENMSYINPTARKAQFKEARPRIPIETHSKEHNFAGNTGQMTVYFGNLPLNATEETVKSLLSEYYVMNIKTVQHLGMTSAWVITSEYDGESMCAEFNRKRIGDRPIKVEPSHNQTSAQNWVVPAPSFSTRPSTVFVGSDGESPSVRSQSSKIFSAVESLNSGDTWSRRNGVGEPQLQREVAAEPCQQQRRSRPDAYNSDSIFPNEVAVTSLNSDYARTSSLSSGVKDESTSVAELVRLKNGVDYGQGDSDFSRNDRGGPPTLVEGRDWSEFGNASSADYFSSQRVYSDQSHDEPPPLLTRDGFEQFQHDDEVSSSSSYRNQRGVYEKYGPYDGETFNLYVKNIPVGTTLAEISHLFKNAVRIVELSRQSCFALFATFQEVEDACTRSWVIRGSPIYVDVATKFKHLLHTGNGGHDDQFLDLNTAFENLTCTVGSNNQRTVQLHGEKKPMENKTNIIRTEATGNSNVRENFQQSAQPMADMPPLVSRAEHPNSQVNVPPTTNNVVPPNNVLPLLSDEELAKLRANRSHPSSQKASQLARLRNPETIEQDLPASTWKDTGSKQQRNALDSRENHPAAARKTGPPKQFPSFSDFDEDYRAPNLNSVHPKRVHEESNSRQHYPKSSSETLPSAKRGHSSEMQDYFQIDDREDMPVLTQRDNRDSGARFEPLLSGASGESVGLFNRGCAAPRSSRLLSAATASSQIAAASVPSPLKPIPDEMRLKELQRMLMDTFPGDTLPTSYMLPEVINVIIICAVPGFENSFFWGQVASEPYQSELQKMYDQLPRMEELSGSLTVASAALRRGAAKYGEDWCRVWIKVRGETSSTVFFIDFGNFETVSNNSIYELPEEFWKVRPTALPFRVLDSEKLDISDHINQRVTAKVNKKCQRGCIFEIYDLEAQS